METAAKLLILRVYEVLMTYTQIFGKNWAYTVPFEVKNTSTIEKRKRPE
jgi:hypothetical protein